MIKRLAEKKITDWITKSKNALLVSGARQVGKTFSIRRCLKQQNCDYLEINLIERPELVEVINKSSSIKDLILNLSAATNYSFVKGKTIIFIDEIQEAKDVVTKIKFWVDEGSYRFILSGSLLGVELNSLRSAPVGYLEEIKMFPLNFEEFVKASGLTDEIFDYLKDCFINKTTVSDLIHNKLLQHFQRYLVIGGMPAAVKEYIETGDMNRVFDIHQNIIELYKKDFTKYEKQEKKLMLISIYNQIPSQLLKQNKRFCYADIKKGLRFEKIESSFLWLESAGVAISVYNATQPKLSLIQNAKSSLLKLYLSDVGLLSHLYGKSTQMNLLLGNDKVNMGGIYENAVAQELNTNGFCAYFFNSHKIGELDFVIEFQGRILPIEVKSGKEYYVHSAISNALAEKDYNIKEGFVFSNSNLIINEKITYYPVYMCTFIKDDTELPVLSLL